MVDDHAARCRFQGFTPLSSMWDNRKTLESVNPAWRPVQYPEEHLMAAMKPWIPVTVHWKQPKRAGIVMRVPLEGGGRFCRGVDLRMRPPHSATNPKRSPVNCQSVETPRLRNAGFHVAGVRSGRHRAVNLQRLLGDARPGEVVDAAFASRPAEPVGFRRILDEGVDRIGSAPASNLARIRRRSVPAFRSPRRRPPP